MWAFPPQWRRWGFPPPKSAHIDRMRDNIDVFDFQLTDDDLKRIQALDRYPNDYGPNESPEQVKRLSTFFPS